MPGLGALMVFLILAAQVRALVAPLAVLLACPSGTFGALAAVWLRSMSNDVYFQIGLVTLLGLAARTPSSSSNTPSTSTTRGMSAAAAAIESSAAPVPPILMTSLAFILGVLPLAISRRRRQARQAVGTGVMGGMLAATFLAVFFVPLFYRLIADKKLAETRSTENLFAEVRKPAKATKTPRPGPQRPGSQRKTMSAPPRRFRGASLPCRRGAPFRLRRRAPVSPPPFSTCPAPGPDPRPTPPPSPPTGWENAGGRSAPTVLDRLVDRALANNADAQVAAAPGTQARAIANLTDADLYPVLSAGASGSRGKHPARQLPRPPTCPHPEQLPRHPRRQLRNRPLGKIPAGQRSRQADLFAAQSARQAVRLALAAGSPGSTSPSSPPMPRKGRPTHPVDPR